MEEKREREWKSVLCPEGKGRAWVMCEMNILSEKGRILEKTLRLMDCHNRCLTEFGGGGCRWECEGVIGKRRGKDREGS